MGLNQEQFSSILREYDNTRMRNQQILDRRHQEIERKIPAYRKLTEEISSDAMNAAKQALTEGSVPPSFRERNKYLSQQKANLLVNNGYPADYLTPVCDCNDCNDTGYIENKRCHCLNQSIATYIYKQSGIKDILHYENFEHFRFHYYPDDRTDPVTSLTPLQNIKKIVSYCKNYTETFDEHHDNLLFYGNTGVGKTFLSHCIAKELLDTYHSVIYLTSLQLFDILEKNKFGKNPDTDKTSGQIQYILDCDLLIIDDLGTELTNSFTISQLYYFMEDRHTRHKSIIISTNLSFDELRERYSERIFSRFTNYKFLKLTGEDIRQIKAQNNE